MFSGGGRIFRRFYRTRLSKRKGLNVATIESVDLGNVSCMYSYYSYAYVHMFWQFYKTCVNVKKHFSYKE